MKVTGTQIRNEIKLLTTELSSVNNGFEESLTYFPGETKPDPLAIGAQIIKLERTLGIWQAAQKEYNINTPITFGKRTISLQEAVSIIGGYSRVSKLFRTASGAGKKDPYARRFRAVRSSESTKVTESESITREQAIEEFKRIEKQAAELRKEIGKANNNEVEIGWLDSALASL